MGGQTNGWQEEGEGVKRTICAHVDDHIKPLFPVLATLPKVPHLENLGLGTGLVIVFEAAEGECLFFGTQESRFVGEVMHHPITCKADQYSHQAFEDEDLNIVSILSESYQQSHNVPKPNLVFLQFRSSAQLQLLADHRNYPPKPQPRRRWLRGFQTRSACTSMISSSSHLGTNPPQRRPERSALLQDH